MWSQFRPQALSLLCGARVTRGSAAAAACERRPPPAAAPIYWLQIKLTTARWTSTFPL